MKFCFWIQLVALLVCVTVWADDSWIAYDRLLASDGAEEDYFGYAVTISGDLMVIGAYQDDDGANMSGSAYVFDFNGTSWSQQAKLMASDRGIGDCFGYSVSACGDYVVAGAYKDDSGSAYIFKHGGEVWTQQKILPTDGASGDNFGCGVSIDGNYVVVGAYKDDGSGSAYVFEFNGTSWSQQAKLIANDAAAGDYFGWNVSISYDYIIVGALLEDNEKGTNSGSAYIFKRDGTSWTQQAKLIPDEGAGGDFFGRSVCIDGDYAIAGSENSDATVGSAYIFKRDGETWIQQAKLIASDATAGDFFGWNVSIDGDCAIVGSKAGSDGVTESGFVYVFRRNGATWAQEAKLGCPDATDNDKFAQAVCINENRIASGAYGVNGNAGVAYIYELQLPCPSADLTGDCFVDMNDFAIFTKQWMTSN